MEVLSGISALGIKSTSDGMVMLKAMFGEGSTLRLQASTSSKWRNGKSEASHDSGAPTDPRREVAVADCPGAALRADNSDMECQLPVEDEGVLWQATGTDEFSDDAVDLPISVGL